MIRPRLGLLVLCTVVFGVMAFSASAAQAETGARWLVLKTEGGALFTDAEIEANQEKFEGSIENGSVSISFKVIFFRVKILCTVGKILGALLGANASIKKGAKVKFEGCIALVAGTKEKLAGCLPHSAGQAEASGIIETNSSHALAELHSLATSKDDVILVLPDVGEEFVSILMGEACAVGEEIPIFGKLTLWDCVEEGKGILKHTTVHLLTEFKPLTKLYAISDTAEHLETSLEGSSSTTLASGRSWAVSLK